MVHLEYDIKPDENNVIDGRELAKFLIEDAHKLIACYARSLDEADKILYGIIRRTLYDIHEYRAAYDIFSSRCYIVDTPEEEKAAAFERHAAATQEKTRTLLEILDEPWLGDYGLLSAKLEETHEEIERLRADCEDAHKCVFKLAQIAGVANTGSVERVLDVLWAASAGANRPDHELLPFPHEDDATVFARSAEKQEKER